MIFTDCNHSLNRVHVYHVTKENCYEFFHVKEYSKLVGSNENVALGMVAGKRSGC